LATWKGKPTTALPNNFCLAPSSLVRLCDASYLCCQSKSQSIISIVAIPEPLHLLLRYKHSARALLLVCHRVCGSRSPMYWKVSCNLRSSASTRCKRESASQDGWNGQLANEFVRFFVPDQHCPAVEMNRPDFTSETDSRFRPWKIT
jgi:hypothetical protein